MKLRSRFAQTLLTAALATACGPVIQNADGPEGDEERDRALAVFVDRSVTDRLDSELADTIDWKYIDVTEQGKLKVTVSVDQPEQLKNGEIELFDEFGNRVERFRIEKNQTVYVFDVDVQKIPNKYFVRTFAAQGQSVYSVGVALALPPAPPAPVVVAPPTQPPPPEPPPPPVRTPPRPGPKPVVRPADPTPRPPPPDPPPAAAAITGRVVRVIPIEGNDAVTISFRLDAAVGINKGARGTLFKDGSPIGSFSVGSVQGRTATARVNVPPGKASGNLTVRIEAN